MQGGLAESVIQDAVIDMMKSRFPSRVFLALQMKDAAAVRQIYDLALQFPRTATCRDLAKLDIVIDGCVYGDNFELQVCFVDDKPCVLKSVTLCEYNRAEELQRANAKHTNLVDFQLHKHGNKYFVIMPLLPITVASFHGLPERKALRLWDQMSSVLEYLHNLNFAHKDVKPDNICVNNEGNYVLIDLGDTVRFNIRSNSTALYVPADIDETEPASAEIDWWMLAMTVYDAMQPMDNCLAFQGPKFFSTIELLKWFQENNHIDLLDKITDKTSPKVKVVCVDALIFVNTL